MKHYILLAPLLSGALAFAQAQPAPSPASKPVVQVGEVARYAVKLVTEGQNTEDTVTVTSVADGQIKARYTRANRTPAETEVIYTDEWNPVLTGVGSRLEPAAQTLKFPLQVGNAWDAKYAVQTANGAKSRVEMAGKVVGYEKVPTPAGEFDAFKVQSSGWVNGVSWNGSFKVQQTVWYAPSIGRLVRSEYKEFRRDGVDTVSELKSFSPGK